MNFLSLTMICGPLVIIILAYYLITYWFRLLTIIHYVEKLPGPPNNFLIGNCAPLFCEPEGFFKILDDWSLKHFPIFKITIGPVGSVIVVNPEDCEIILSNVKHNDKSEVYVVLKYWLRTGLLMSTGEKWHSRRKILTPTFHFNILQKFLGVINKHSKLLAETLEEECNKTETDVVPIISKSALDIIGETAMGSKFHKASTAEIDYKEAVHSMGELTFYKIMRPMYYYSSFFEMLYFFTPSYRKERKLLMILHGFTNKMIDERERDFNGIPKTEHEDEDTNLYMKKEKMAMLDLLLSLKQKGLIDDEGIREEVDTFMLEGHDTVSSGLSFCLMLLACNRKIQDQIVKEMEEVLVDIGKEPTFNELQELKFMERCIKESLRMYPSVFYISRKLGEDTVTKDGYLLKSGTIVSFLIMHMQRNPKVYPNPDKFDPDRFLPENTKKRNPFAYLPFSAGPRNCIGQKFSFLEIKSILCSVLSNYILEPIDTPETIKLIPQFVLRAKDGIKVKFTKRNV